MGSPSGTAATARLTPAPRLRRRGWPRTSPAPITPSPPSAANGRVTALRRARRASTPLAWGRSSRGPMSAKASVSRPVATTTAVPVAGDDGGALVDHRGALRDDGREARRRVLGDRERLAGEGRLVDLEPVGLEHPGIGPDHRTGLDGDHAAAHQGLGRHRRGSATLEDRGQDLVRLVERAHGALRPEALGRAQQGVGARHRTDHRGIGGGPDHGRQRRAARQHRDEGVGQLARHRLTELERRGHGAGHRPTAGEGVARRQPRTAGAERREHLVGLELVPRRPGRRDGAGPLRQRPGRTGAVADCEQRGHVHARERAATSGGAPGHREQRAGARPQQRHGRALPAHLVRHARGLDEEGRIRQAVEHHDVAAPHRDVARGDADAHVGGTERAHVVAAQRQHHTAIGLQPSDRVGQRRTTVDRQVGPDAGDEPRRTTCHGHHVLRLLGGVDQLDRTERELVDHREHRGEAVAVGQAEHLGTPRQPLHRTARTEVGREVELRDRTDRPPRPPLHEERLLRVEEGAQALAHLDVVGALEQLELLHLLRPAQEQLGLDADRVDGVEAAQRAGVGDHDAAVGEHAPEVARERLPPDLGGLRHAGHEHRGRGARVAGGEARGGGAGQRGERRAVGERLHGAAGCGHGPRLVVVRVDPATGRLAVQLRLDQLPAPSTRGGLGVGRRALETVDHQPQRSLCQSLRRGVDGGQGDVGDRRAEHVLDHPPQTRLAVDEGHERRELDGDGGGLEDRAERPDPHARDVGHESGQGAPGRLAVAGVVGPVEPEPLAVRAVRLLDLLDHVDEVVGLDGVAVEGHHDATHHRVHLGPVDPFDATRAPLRGAGPPAPTRAASARAHLDVCLAVAHPGPPVAAAGPGPPHGQHPSEAAGPTRARTRPHHARCLHRCQP